MLSNRVECRIERRLLVNYRIDPARAQSLLPTRFRPQIVSGWAVGSVCFLRLRDLRPGHVPSTFGITTENVAHRFAVEWNDDEGCHSGVFVPRRDTNSRIAVLGGDKVFPGAQRLARFEVRDIGPELRIEVESRDRTINISVTARECSAMGGELFSGLEDAIGFFRRGPVGYTSSGSSDCLTGVRMECESWDAQPVSIEHMTSSIFDNTEVFPMGSCTIDSGLLMRNLEARWITADGLIPDELTVGVS